MEWVEKMLYKCVETLTGDPSTYQIMKEYLADEEEDLYWSQGALELIECMGAGGIVFQSTPQNIESTEVIKGDFRAFLCGFASATVRIVYQFLILNSTLLFFALPCSVVLGATGWSAP